MSCRHTYSLTPQRNAKHRYGNSNYGSDVILEVEIARIDETENILARGHIER